MVLTRVILVQTCWNLSRQGASNEERRTYPSLLELVLTKERVLMSDVLGPNLMKVGKSWSDKGDSVNERCTWSKLVKTW